MMFTDYRKLSRHLLMLLLIGTLTLGAIAILGFLSFGGMYALWPILPLAFASLFLSVGYEGEIYLQNIRQGLNKLLKPHYLKRHLAKQHLIEHFPDRITDSTPQFFKDYKATLILLNHCDDLKEQKRLKKELSTMAKWYADLLATKGTSSKKRQHYQQSLMDWMQQNGQQSWQRHLLLQRGLAWMSAGFSALAGVVMAVGSVSLTLEVFAAIPALAAILSIPSMGIPLIIVGAFGLAIAGAAYAILTYNNVTKMIQDKVLQKWIGNIRQDFKNERVIKGSVKSLLTVILISMAIALTICTAGTWWSISRSAQPLLGGVWRMPMLIAGIITTVLAMASGTFNVVNTMETSHEFDELTTDKHKHNHKDDKPDSEPESKWQLLNPNYWIQKLHKTENYLQIINPFRLILKLTVTPLRLLCFIGHLLSIGVTADRLPKIPMLASALFGMFCEGFEDTHYFMDHDHHKPDDNDTEALLEHYIDNNGGHSHNYDLPTLIIITAFSPIYLASMSWDFLASHLGGNKPITFKHAFNKAFGRHEHKHEHKHGPLEQPSAHWHTVFALNKIQSIEKKLDNPMAGTSKAESKKAVLNQLAQNLKKNSANPAQAFEEVDLADCNKHRLFGRHQPRTAQKIHALHEHLQARATQAA